MFVPIDKALKTGCGNDFISLTIGSLFINIIYMHTVDLKLPRLSLLQHGFLPKFRCINTMSGVYNMHDQYQQQEIFVDLCYSVC